jgi:Immunity protein 42
MFFGQKEEFAIECLITSINRPQDITFGKIFIWIENERIGDDIDVVLNIPINSFNASASLSGYRKSEKLEKMTEVEVMSFLDQTLWREDVSNLSFQDIQDLEKEYGKYNICTNFSESFDGESLYLIEAKNSERFVWKIFSRNIVKEIYLRSNTYKEVVEDFTQWYLQETSFPLESLAV